MGDEQILARGQSRAHGDVHRGGLHHLMKYDGTQRSLNRPTQGTLQTKLGFVIVDESP